MSDEVVRLGGYKRLLEDIQELLERARAQAYKAVDNIRVQSYWHLTSAMQHPVIYERLNPSVK